MGRDDTECSGAGAQPRGELIANVEYFILTGSEL